MKFPDFIFDILGTPFLAALFVCALMLESKFQLRKRVESKTKRLLRNGGVGLISLALLRLVLIPAMVWIAINNNLWHIGINYLYQLPFGIEFLIGFLLLDYSNYLWHMLNHKSALLWRFHHVHHTDLELDVTTGLRFHFGELIGSVFFRGAMVLLIGASPLLVLVYEIIYEAATNFQHSNWKLPFYFEKGLNRILVTPRMHGIHHSIVKRETDSNFSVIFSFWDRLHKTIRLNISQNEVTIGMPSYRDPSELTVWKLLIMPFKSIRDWKFANGRHPERQNDHTEDADELRQ